MALAHLHRCQEEDQAIVVHQVRIEITACHHHEAATGLEVEEVILPEAATHQEEVMVPEDRHRKATVEAGIRAAEELAIHLRERWEQWGR